MLPLLLVTKLKPTEANVSNHRYQPSYEHLTYTYIFVKPPGYCEMGHNHGNWRKTNSAVDHAGKGLPSKTTKEEHMHIFCVMYTPWAIGTLEQLCGSPPRAPLQVAHSSPASGILAASGSELREQPPAEVTDSVRGWPASNDWAWGDTKAHPHWHSWGQLWRVIPGPEHLMELAKDSVFASPYASSHRPYFLTDVSPNYSLQLTFWLQFSVSESDSREPHQRKFNMWLIPHI